MSGVRVTVEDLATGEKESQEVDNDYVLICAGSCYLAHVNDYPQKGTQILTIKGREGLGDNRSRSDAVPQEHP